MFISADTLDDLMQEVFNRLINLPFSNPTSKGAPTSELIGVLLELRQPRARLSLTETRGKAFSTLGELFWYLSGSNELEFIKYYIRGYEELSDDNKTIRGGYGPRLFNMHGKFNQISNIIELLTKRSGSRRATIQLYDASDLSEDYIDIPCTCSLQFFVRDNRLDMFTTMRSNDSYIGLPHDIFCFTMLQEIVARSLGVNLGLYKHAVGSLHLYETDKNGAEQYLEEGLQSTLKKYQMPSMPVGDPWPSILVLKKIETKIRYGENIDLKEYSLNPYWFDLASLLKIHSLIKRKKLSQIETVKNSLNSNVYNRYINEKYQKIDF